MKLKIYRNNPFRKITGPLFCTKVPAGFPSPADDYIENNLDLNEYLISHPAATFFVRVTGDSMTGAGINSGDILIVDRSVNAINGSVIVAVVNGEFTVKRFFRHGSLINLVPENPAYKPVEVKNGSDFEVWGVVMHVIHTLR
jgi:DNA polymerase V